MRQFETLGIPKIHDRTRQQLLADPQRWAALQRPLHPVGDPSRLDSMVRRLYGDPARWQQLQRQVRGSTADWDRVLRRQAQPFGDADIWRSLRLQLAPLRDPSVLAALREQATVKPDPEILEDLQVEAEAFDSLAGALEGLGGDHVAGQSRVVFDLSWVEALPVAVAGRLLVRVLGVLVPLLALLALLGAVPVALAPALGLLAALVDALEKRLARDESS